MFDGARNVVAQHGGPRVFIHHVGRTLRGTAHYQRAVLATLARAAPHVHGDVTLVFASDARVRGLNRRYRGLDRATDVLAFPLSDGTAAGEPFGDVVISVDAARRQAHTYGGDIQSEIMRLAVHGTLHLCGYDHHERREAARMHGLTRRLLRALSGTRRG